jgi:hypothetical protein
MRTDAAFSGPRRLPWTAAGSLEAQLAAWRSDPQIGRNLVLDE